MPVSKLIRFFNLIIDLAIIYLLCIVAGLILAIFGDSVNGFMINHPAGFEYILFVAPLVIFVLYYFLMEAFAGGRTIGKMITGSRTVDVDGMPIFNEDCFLKIASTLNPDRAI